MIRTVCGYMLVIVVLITSALIWGACSTGQPTASPTATPLSTATQVPPTATASSTPTSVPTATAEPARPVADGVSPLVDGNNILAPVDKRHILAGDFVPADLVVLPSPPAVRSPIRLRSAAYEHLGALLQEAQGQGIHLAIASGFRSYSEQEGLFSGYVQQMGQAQAERISARPGHSEHQLGTAIDFTSASAGYGLGEGFAQTPEGAWLGQNAPRFGFVMSYPAGKEPVTGYAYEPWHFRYVGLDIAQAVAARGITLTEYLAGRP